MEDDIPGLAVGFTIETGASSDELNRIAQLMNSTEVKAVQSAANIERATGGMVNLGRATAQISTFGNIATKEMRAAALETARAEKAGEGMVRQLQRQIETCGKTTSQIRDMRAEERALAAEGRGMTELAGRIRSLNTEMNRLEAASAGGAAGVRGSGSAFAALSPQIQDAATQISMGANAFSVLAIQGGQVAGQLTHVGGAVGKFATFMMGPFGIAITVAVLALGTLTKGLFGADEAMKAVEVQADHTGSAQSALGEMFDLATGKIVNNTQALRDNIYMQMVAMQQKAIIARQEATEKLSAGGLERPGGWDRAWRQISNPFEKRHETEAWMDSQTNRAANLEKIGKGVAAGTISLERAGAALEAARKKGMLTRDEYFAAQDSMSSFRNARSAGEAEKLMREALQTGKLPEAMFKADKATTKKAESSNRHAESLIREAEATEAQIRNLYALAAAYGDSGAAALVAEARVKAESDAIKKRGDVEAMVNRQVQLAIAQRVADAAKSTAAVQAQVEVQRAVNDAVAAGQVPAERAAELVKDQLADLPLLQAAQAAQQRGLVDEAMKVMKVLADQQALRADLRREEERARFNTAFAAGADRLADIREELRLVGATNRERNVALAVMKATREAEKFNPDDRAAYIGQQRDIAVIAEDLVDKQREYNDALNYTADKWDLIAQNVQSAAQGIAGAFGEAGRAVGDLASIYADYRAQEERADATHREAMKNLIGDHARQREIAKFQLASSTAQIGLYGDMASAAKGFFSEKSKGYRAIMAVEKVFRAFEFAMSIKAMVQDVMETTSSVANSAARATAAGAEGVATQAKLPFPLNIAAMAATAAALVAAGIAVLGSGGGGKSNLPQSNTGTGTVLGDGSAQSESIKNALNALKEVDTLMLNYSRQMAASLQSIESQIGGFASLLVRNADSLNASGGVAQGFNPNAIGSILGSIPLVGGILKGLFGTKTTVIGSGLYGGAQSIGSILGGGFDASYYSDVQKKKKFLGLTTSTKYSTQYTGADGTLENQFTLILRSFNDAILAAADPLGASTSAIQQKLNSFVISLGKIDLQGLTGEQIEEKLTAVFGAAADSMASAAFPLITQFQKVGEGAFETLVRVASTLEAVSSSLDILGQSAQGMSIAMKLGLADQFESVSALTGAVDAYFQSFYTKEEQAAARTAQMASVFQSLGLAMPNTLAGFRELVEAQNLNTVAGQATYATLLKLAPAFAELQTALEGAKSAADIASEKADLQRQLLELNGDTAALRALQLAKLDASNRALQQQVWAIQDAQAAAKAAEELRKAWQSVGDTIMDEVRRIRGLTDAAGGNSFAALQGQFNAATLAARGGDMDAAKSLPQLSQALLAAAADAATSRQELDRIRAQTAAALEATYGLIGQLGGNPAATNATLLNAGASSQPGGASNDNGSASLAASIDELRADLAAQRAEHTAALTAIAANTGKTAKTLENVTADSGGDAVSTRAAA